MVFSFLLGIENKKVKIKWKMKICDEWGNGNTNTDFLLQMIFIFFCLNQPNKKKIEGRGMKMEQ